MKFDELLESVAERVETHVRSSKGYEQESFVNPFTPADSVSAFKMAQLLTERNRFDVCVSVAPEGHVYGYFFALFGATVHSVHVGYPPSACTILDDLSGLEGQRVLILEDDVASGTTLRLVTETLQEFRPQAIDLFLGRPKQNQILEHIDPRIRHVHIAEDFLDTNDRQVAEAEFISFFSTKPTGPN